MFSRKVKTNAVPSGRRIYAIGDVHGRIDLLDALLRSLEADSARRGPAETLVLLLGDLIDRGPCSAEVVERAMQPLGWATMRALRGNHEAVLLRALDSEPHMLSFWLRNGGDAALRSWGCNPSVLDISDRLEAQSRLEDAIPSDVQTFLLRCPLSLHLGGYFFVHAGIRPGVLLAAQTEDDMLWIRDPFLKSKRKHPACVVHGHTITKTAEIMPNRIGIDTGAYLSGRLTAVAFENEERWIVEALGEAYLSRCP